jgi:hypothetical protein
MDEDSFEKTNNQGWNKSIKAQLMMDDDEFNPPFTQELDHLG